MWAEDRQPQGHAVGPLFPERDMEREVEGRKKGERKRERRIRETLQQNDISEATGNRLSVIISPSLTSQIRAIALTEYPFYLTCALSNKDLKTTVSG